MRLLVSGSILGIATLDFAFGRPGTTLHVLAVLAGVLVALTVVIDHYWPDPAERPAGSTAKRRET
jgi:hypothetical protein